MRTSMSLRRTRLGKPNLTNVSRMIHTGWSRTDMATFRRWIQTRRVMQRPSASYLSGSGLLRKDTGARTHSTYQTQSHSRQTRKKVCTKISYFLAETKRFSSLTRRRSSRSTVQSIRRRTTTACKSSTQSKTTIRESCRASAKRIATLITLPPDPSSTCT